MPKTIAQLTAEINALRAEVNALRLLYLNTKEKAEKGEEEIEKLKTKEPKP